VTEAPTYAAVLQVTTYIKSTNKKSRAEVESPIVPAKKRYRLDNILQQAPVEQVAQKPVVQEPTLHEPVVSEPVVQEPMLFLPRHVEVVEPRKSNRERTATNRFKARRA